MYVKISLGTNIASLVAQRRLDENSSSLSQVFERLASGQRINKAADDAAGLAIASALNVDGRVYSQAIRNVGDSISMLSIADGALAELSGIVTRQRELAAQSANGVYTTAQRTALNTELQALGEEYQRILSVTKFNGRGLFDASEGAVSVQAGYGADGSISADYLNIREEIVLSGDGTYTNYDRTFGAGTPMTSPLVMSGDMNNDGIDDIIAVQANDMGGGNWRAYVAVYLGEEGSTTYTLDAQRAANLSSVFGGIEDIRLEADLVDLGSDGDLDVQLSFEIDVDTPGTLSVDGTMVNTQNTGTFGLNAFDSAPNPTITNALQASVSGDFNNDGIADIATSSGTSLRIRIQDTSSTASLVGDDITQGEMSLLSASSARTALDDLEELLDLLAITRGKVGAIQSRFASAAATLAASRENSAAAEARIKNADVAEESALLAKNSIRNNVTSAVLAQANIQPQIALDLLRGIG